MFVHTSILTIKSIIYEVLSIHNIKILNNIIIRYTTGERNLLIPVFIENQVKFG